MSAGATSMVTAYTSSGTCRNVALDELLVFNDVGAPVGALEHLKNHPAGNRRADVLVVQQLLNKIATTNGGQARADGKGALAEDGLVGRFTREAIVAFQRKQFPAYAPDGVVERSKRTIYRLNMLAFPSVDAALLASGRAAFASAAACIQKARMALGAYLTQLGMASPLFRNARVEKLVNDNFHLNRSMDAVRDLQSIIRTLTDMYGAIAHIVKGPTGKPGFGILDTMPLSDNTAPSYAYTFAGGYKYLQGKTLAELAAMAKVILNEPDLKLPDMGANLRVDMIYITRRVLNAAPGVLTYAIIHELAHFVSGIVGDIDCIADRAYYHRDRLKYERLGAYEAMTNADSFSQFCWQNQYGYPYLPVPGKR